MNAQLLSLLGLAAAAVVAGLLLGRRVQRGRIEARLLATRKWADSIRAAAASGSAEVRRAAELGAREEAALAGAGFDAVADLREAELSAQEARLEARSEALGRLAGEIATRRGRLDGALGRHKEREEEGRKLAAEAAGHERGRLQMLESRAAVSRAALRASIIESETEAARVAGGQLLRSTDQSGSDPEQIRRAKRVMGIAVGRFSGHYLTERLSSVVPLPAGVSLAQLVGPEERNLRAIESATRITLSVTDSHDGIRMEGLDGVGREVVRRTFTWMARNARAAADPAGVARSTREIAGALDRELLDLGRRAFAALEIPRAHDEIVSLVGRLNYRTSFTQNQWKHAVEAAFLCGMMADELDLDVKLARRAALMHDIGKALTHELDGSHAVIGADYARRLGESEIVANAIGAHHTDEPFSSPYAYLVAAADAMSGARPGARRQTEDNYVARLDDLERITRGFRGVEEAYAVQGGREVRIYVAEDQVSDQGAVTLSSEIARRISEEMTFPGQIRVTVIREMKAIEVAN